MLTDFVVFPEGEERR